MRPPDPWRWRWLQLRARLVKNVARLRNESLRPGQRQGLRYDIMTETSQSLLKEMDLVGSQQPPEPDPTEEDTL